LNTHFLLFKPLQASVGGKGSSKQSTPAANHKRTLSELAALVETGNKSAHSLKQTRTSLKADIDLLKRTNSVMFKFHLPEAESLVSRERERLEQLSALNASTSLDQTPVEAASAPASFILDRQVSEDKFRTMLESRKRALQEEIRAIRSYVSTTEDGTASALVELKSHQEKMMAEMKLRLQDECERYEAAQDATLDKLKRELSESESRELDSVKEYLISHFSSLRAIDSEAQENIIGFYRRIQAAHDSIENKLKKQLAISNEKPPMFFHVIQELQNEIVQLEELEVEVMHTIKKLKVDLKNYERDKASVSLNKSRLASMKASIQRMKDENKVYQLRLEKCGEKKKEMQISLLRAKEEAAKLAEMQTVETENKLMREAKGKF
jgi:hypothetical protein